MKKISLYIYNLDTNTLGQVMLNATFERQSRRVGLNDEHELYFAIDSNTKTRIQIAEKSETIFYDKKNHRLNVWLYDPNLFKAKSLIGNYILETISSKIDEYSAVLDDLNKSKAKALELIESSKR